MFVKRVDSLTESGYALEKTRRFWKWLFPWVRTIGFSVALALFVSSFVVANASVASGSMESTVMTGDRVICNRLAYLFGEPRRFDIVLFKFPYGDKPVNYVKRIIGLPGEHIEIRDGKVYVDGAEEPLKDFFTAEVPHGSFGPFDVPKDCYFVLGDNRNNSYDSKSWDTPCLPRSTIIAKAMFAYFPAVRLYRDIE